MTLEQNMEELFSGKLNGLSNVMYADTTIMGKLPNSNKIVKIRLNDGHKKDHYDEVVVIVIDKNANERTDYQTFGFYSMWGKLPTNNPNFREGVIPHIWQERMGKADWYVTKPNEQQKQILIDKINRYISYFA